jgi:hypothetical protein
MDGYLSNSKPIQLQKLAEVLQSSEAEAGGAAEEPGLTYRNGSAVLPPA